MDDFWEHANGSYFFQTDLTDRTELFLSDRFRLRRVIITIAEGDFLLRMW